MCYEWGASGAYREHRKPASLEVDTVKRVIAECLPLHPVFELFGGEPLLYPGLWEILRLITDGGCEVAFPSNGTLVEEHVVELVECRPTRLWISLDGPALVNDAQRGPGIFARVLRGLDALVAEKRRRSSRFPELGISFVVTPGNHRHIDELFLRTLDLSGIARVSVELQSFTTSSRHRAYEALLREHFQVPSAPHARAYVREADAFASIDRQAVADQLEHVRQACVARGVQFSSQPKSFARADLDAYLRGDGDALSVARRRCAIPWACAEISARGDVTTCHTFYDLSLGSVYQESLLEIWRGERARRWRAQVREGLLPICTACCRYYQ
jgi:MoaA/NifB/PqqE/SkfB family radical SAM enzyme